MTVFELQTSGVGRDRSTNWATTTAPEGHFLSTFTKNWANEPTKTKSMNEGEILILAGSFFLPRDQSYKYF